MAGWLPLFASSFFNAGRSQVNFNFLQGGGEYPYLNRFKCAQSWSFKTSNATTPKTPDYFDTDGYPSSIVFGGVTTVCPIEDDTTVNIVILWDGRGVLGFASATAGSLTLANGGLDNSVSGAGRAEFSVSGSVTNLTVEITTTNGGNTVRNIRICRAGAEEALLTGGAVYGVKFKSRLAQAKFGVLRFFNWVQINQSNVGLWAHRKPTTYFNYSGSEWRTEYLCNAAGHGVTTNSGADYTVSAPSTWSGLTHGAMAHWVYNASSPTSATVTFTNGTTNLNWPANSLAIGNQIYFSDGTVPSNITANGLVFPFTNKYFVKTIVDPDNITISATNGGAAITFTGGGTCTGRTIVTQNIGGTGAVPVITDLCAPMTNSGGTFPIGGSENSLATGFYDSNLQAYISKGGNSIGPGGLVNGAPPETFVQLCREVGAHPWFSIPAMACTPMGATTAADYTTQLATYMRDNLPSWAIPRFEVANELFNDAAGFVSKKYAEAVAVSYGWGASDGKNWLGRANSTVGQAINAVYGGTPASGTRYVMVCGVQTGTGNSPADCTSSNPILASTKYLLQTPQSGYTASAASGWATSVAPANYSSPATYGRNQELQDAFNWTNAVGAPAKAVVAASYVDTLTQGFQVTVTNGTPGVVNKVAHGMTVGQIGQFMLEGTANTGVSSSANLWVGTVPDADHFTISSTDPSTTGVTGVNFSGSGTGNIWWIPNGNATLPQLLVRYKNWKAWAAGFSVNFMDPYEGGYSPDYDTSNLAYANITAMTKGATTVITAPTSFIQGIRSPDNANSFNPAAVVGMYIRFEGLPSTNGWDAYNFSTSGVAYQVTVVSGASITIALDSSARAGNLSSIAAFGVYSDATGSRTVAQTWLNGLRAAGKNVTSLQTHLTTDYNNVVTAGGRMPSMFQMGGTSNVWSVLDPDIHVSTNPPQWLSAIAFNA